MHMISTCPKTAGNSSWANITYAKTTAHIWASENCLTLVESNQVWKIHINKKEGHDGISTSISISVPKKDMLSSHALSLSFWTTVLLAACVPYYIHLVMCLFTHTHHYYYVTLQYTNPSIFVLGLGTMQIRFLLSLNIYISTFS